jgi:hypothetical protein
MRRLVVGATLLVSYLAFGLAPAVASANVLQNGDFSQGLAGWQEVCDTYGEQPVQGAHCMSTSANGLAVTGSYPYTGAQQTVATSTAVVLSGTVTVTNMATCNTDDGVLVRAILRDASNAELGRLTFYHHPYASGCTPYTYTNDAKDYYQDMPSWVPGTGAQSFQMDIGSLMAQVPGVDPSAVRNITVELLDYADLSQPTLTFSTFDLSSGSAPPASQPPAPVNTGPPTILGTPQQVDTLMVSPGSWNGTVTSYAINGLTATARERRARRSPAPPGRHTR